MKADFSGYATKAGLKCTDGRTIMPDAFKHQDALRVPLVWQHGHDNPENVLGHAILENRSDGVYAYGFFNKTQKATHTKELLEHGDIKMMSIWANDLIERAGRVLHGAIREVSLVLSGANPGAVIENVTIAHSDGEIEKLEGDAIIYTGLTLEHSSADVDDDDNDDDDDDTDDTLQHAAGEDDGETIQDIYDSMSDKQKDVLHFMLGQAVEDAAGNSSLQQDNLTDNTNSTTVTTQDQKGSEMTHNVFEKTGAEGTQNVLAHADMLSIVENAKSIGSLKRSVDQYALAHGITDIDVLFPEAKLVTDTPEWVKRRTEWVSDLLASCRKSPFSRIKTLQADLTYEDARAKGYVKGDLKKEEFFGVAGRTTTPKTIYKKQALDRDDILDITDFNVVTWLKAEMRIMLDEELARAILIGDGRDPSHEDKINEGNIRPIAKDHELYTTTINVNVGDANSDMTEVIDAVTMNRYKLKGTGMPTFYTTEYWIARFLTLRDNDNKRMYKNLAELALDLRVSSVVAVEAMMDDPTMIGVMVNPVDYVIGSDKGGEVNMFDDFDIDYNKEKYLIETRVSGALVKVKSAMVIRSVPAAAVLVSPVAPTFDTTTGVLSITNTTGVVYKNGATVVNAAGSPYAAIAPGATIIIDATPASASYYFESSDVDQWVFTRDPA